ncbi:MAG: hypothetical protein PVI43_00820 [Candidatus Bathyarchaeota archaeon]|jgi:hypothetical protein
MKTKAKHFNIDKICKSIKKLEKELNEDEIARVICFLVENPKHILMATIYNIFANIK